MVVKQLEEILSCSKTIMGREFLGRNALLETHMSRIAHMCFLYDRKVVAMRRVPIIQKTLRGVNVGLPALFHIGFAERIFRQYLKRAGYDGWFAKDVHFANGKVPEGYPERNLAVRKSVSGGGTSSIVRMQVQKIYEELREKLEQEEILVERIQETFRKQMERQEWKMAEMKEMCREMQEVQREEEYRKQMMEEAFRKFDNTMKLEGMRYGVY